MDIAEKIKIMEESKDKIDRLTDALKEKEINKAKAEYVYRQALAKKIIELRSGKDKVPANVIGDVARGSDDVKKLRYARDIAIIERDALKIKLKNEYVELEQIRSLLAFDRSNLNNT